MANYERGAPHHPYPHQEELADPKTMAGLWDLFVQIGKFWRNNAEPQAMRTNLVAFIENRIQLNPNYLDEYVNAVEVINELVAELGEEDGYRKLFTDPEANISSSYGTFQIPETYLIDRTGKVREKIISNQNWVDPAFVARVKSML